MQVSTRTKDYIVDTLALRDELHVLNKVFTDPEKLKVGVSWHTILPERTQLRLKTAGFWYYIYILETPLLEGV